MTMRPCVCERLPPAGELYTTAHCRRCWLWHNHAGYRALWDGTPGPSRPAVAEMPTALCRHLGEQVGLRDCVSCRGKTKLKIFRCGKGHGDVTTADCLTRRGGMLCEDYEPPDAGPILGA